MPDSHRLLRSGVSNTLGCAGLRRQRSWEAKLATTLFLLCAGPTRSSRIGAFASPDEGLDEPGLRAARVCSLPSRFEAALLSSPWRSARETAEAIGAPIEINPALADLDPGPWSGRAFADIAAAEAGALSRWIADPVGGAPGGEAMHAGLARIAPLIDAISATEASACWVTHPMMIRAALSHMLGFPLATTLAIDLAPLSSALLSFNGKWRLQSLGAN